MATDGQLIAEHQSRCAKALTPMHCLAGAEGIYCVPHSMAALVLAVATLTAIIAPGTARSSSYRRCCTLHLHPRRSNSVVQGAISRSQSIRQLDWSQALSLPVLQRRLLGPLDSHLQDVPSSVTPLSTQTLTTPP